MADSVRAKTARSGRRNLVADVVEAAPLAGDMIGIGNVLNAIADAALCIDRDGVIRIANPAAAKLFGYPMESLTGGSIERLVPESVRERHRPLVAGFFERPVARAMGGGLPLAARRRDGEVFFADISLASVESASHGPLALIMVRDVSDQRRERLIAAQYLITQALVESETLEAAAGAVLEAVGPASGAHVAALWVVDDDGAARFVDSWCASDRDRMFHVQSVGVVVPAGSGVLGGVIADAHVHWCSDVLADPRFHRKDLARRLGLHTGVWIPFPEGQDRVLGVLELLFGVVRDPEPVMLAILESFTAQLAQYLALRRSEADRRRVVGQIVQSVEDERRRIASDLHDDTVQVLVASLVSIDRLDKAIAGENAHAHDLLAVVRETLAAATERTRRLIFDMRPQLLEAEGRHARHRRGRRRGRPRRRLRRRRRPNDRSPRPRRRGTPLPRDEGSDHKRAETLARQPPALLARNRRRRRDRRGRRRRHRVPARRHTHTRPPTAVVRTLKHPRARPPRRRTRRRRISARPGNNCQNLATATAGVVRKQHKRRREPRMLVIARPPHHLARVIGRAEIVREAGMLHEIVARWTTN